MSLPTYKIKKIKATDNNTYEIIPERLQGVGLGSFSTSDIIKDGDKIYFDISKETELKSFLKNLTYSSTTLGFPSYILMTYNNTNYGQYYMLINALDLTSINSGYGIMISNPLNSFGFDIVYATASGSVTQSGQTLAWDAGYQNLGADCGYSVELEDVGSGTISSINSGSSWNGILIGKKGGNFEASLPPLTEDSTLALQSDLEDFVKEDDLADVALSGSYNDLSNKPVIVNDVKVNNTTVVSSGVANIVTNTAYNASTNKIATMADIPSVPITSVKTLKTDNTTAQSTSSSEAIVGSGTINLHKISKTGDYGDLLNKPTIPTVSTTGVTDGTNTYNASDKLDKLTYEWNKSVAMGGSGYVKIGSFPMYDSNITIDIDATTAQTYHGTVVIATQNVSTTSMGSAHKVEVYDDPSGEIASAIRVVWTSGSRNYDVYFVPKPWSKNLIHIRAVALSSTATDVCISQTGTAPTSTSGLEAVNKLATVAGTGSYTDLSNQPDLSSLHSHSNKSVLDNIASQTEYNSKGTSTKVPTITTNTSGQVTSITETNIAFPVTDVQLNGASTLSSGVANVKALPNYNLSISTSAGNPREIRFVRVNYSTFDGNNAAYFKIGAMCSHGNGSSYTFLEDIIIGVSASPAVTCQVYKQVQNTSTFVVDNRTVYFGDVYWVVDTANQCVDFYIIGGQYATLMFTPFTKIGNTVGDTSKIIQYTGSATLYSSGTRVWASGNAALYARINDSTQTGSFYATNVYASSDQRLKENIKDVELDCGKVIDQLNIKEFNFKTDENKKVVVGAIAQDLQSILPDKYRANLVSGSKDTYYSINEGKLLYIAIQALKEEREKVKNLEDRIGRLEKILLED